MTEQWHIEQVTLDVSRPNETVTQLIYGRQGDVNSIQVEASVQNNGVTLATSWFADKKVYFETRAPGSAIRKEVDSISDDKVVFTLPEAMFAVPGIIDECFLRIETLDGNVVASTSSFKVYCRLGNLNRAAAAYYLKEIQDMAEEVDAVNAKNQSDFLVWYNAVVADVNGLLDSPDYQPLLHALGTIEYINMDPIDAGMFGVTDDEATLNGGYF